MHYEIQVGIIFIIIPSEYSTDITPRLRKRSAIDTIGYRQFFSVIGMGYDTSNVTHSIDIRVDHTIVNEVVAP
jgi:hypothetical protein